MGMGNMEKCIVMITMEMLHNIDKYHAYEFEIPYLSVKLKVITVKYMVI
jgi:hypothetical protein